MLAGARPILIIDEPQSVEGPRTRESLQAFRPLFTLRYSATHREDYNKVYRLDALDAYNLKLVKKISVKGISLRGTGGGDGYLYLEDIEVDAKRAPVARLEFEAKTKTGLVRRTRLVRAGDDLHELSGGLAQYKGYRVADINGRDGSIRFVNGAQLNAGDVRGDAGEPHLRRIQIRETIRSHFEKERALYPLGIKVLSLFFIDEVAKYRQYGPDGAERNGVYADLFEEEYAALLAEELARSADGDPYAEYLKRIRVKETHMGYFSIDRNNNRYVDPKPSARASDSDEGIGLLMLALAALQNLGHYFVDYKGHELGARMESDMRSELFAHIHPRRAVVCGRAGGDGQVQPGESGLPGKPEELLQVGSGLLQLVSDDHRDDHNHGHRIWQREHHP